LRVIGLDPSLTNFGWALHESSASGSDRCLERGRFQTSPRECFITRYLKMRENVEGLVTSRGILRIGLESPIFNDLWSEGMYGLFLYTCEALRNSKADVVLFSPGQTKAQAREVLGRPPGWIMSKFDMVEAAKEDAGGSKWNHNEADAYWVARTAARFWELYDRTLGLKDLTVLEKKQFTGIHTYKRGKKAGKVEVKGALYREDDRFFMWSENKTGRS